MSDPIDFENLKPEDTAALPDAPEPIAPNPKATKERASWRAFGGDKTDTPKPRAAAKKRAPTAKHGAFTEPLMQMYGAVGAMVAMGDPTCGQAILAAAPKAAQSLDDLAYQNPAVRKALASLTTTTAVGAVIAAHAPIIMAVYMHHSPRGQQLSDAMAKEFTDNLNREERDAA